MRSRFVVRTFREAAADETVEGISTVRLNTKEKPVTADLDLRPPYAGSVPAPDADGDLRSVLNAIAVGRPVGPATIATSLRAVFAMPSPARDVALGTIMAEAMAAGPTVDVAAEAIAVALELDGPRQPALVTAEGTRVVLLAGSGKKGVRTLNISTPAALVAAAAGATIVKIGSGATSSALGSRDLAQALGLRERTTVDGVREDVATHGFSFLAVEPHIPTLDRLYGGRFHAPNLFSFGLAALASPVRGDVTLFGLAHPRVDVAARVLARLGESPVEVIGTRLSGGLYLDEIGLDGDLLRARAEPGADESVESIPLASTPGMSLPRSVDADEAIQRTLDLLAGAGLPSHRALVVRNAAHLLLTSGVTRSRRRATVLAEEVLSSGAAMRLTTGA